jgi:hypothetical protein
VRCFAWVDLVDALASEKQSSKPVRIAHRLAHIVGLELMKHLGHYELLFQKLRGHSTLEEGG